MEKVKVQYFARNLRKLLCDVSFVRQKNLAEFLGVTQQAVSRWVNGVTEPNLDNLVRIADFLDVSIEELLKGEKCKEPWCYKYRKYGCRA
ncbi:MAG: helix-turn-helix domain-containing protein [Firmicutes bacterium]|nr:helix-turn-helix domain-containing protein [Bacillota bacterium]